MAKKSYEAKERATNQCMVLLPATLSGRAVKSSIQSLRTQLNHYEDEQTVKVMLDDFSNMKRITLTIDNGRADESVSEAIQLQSNVPVSTTKNELVAIERWLFHHLKDRIIPQFNNDGKLTFSAEAMNKTKPPLEQKQVLQERLLIIDGSNILTTAYYATKKNMMKNEDGLYTNAVYVMTKKLLDLLSRSKPTHVAICWDEGRNTFRRKIYSDYKANRKETERELKEQFQTARQLFKEIGIAQYSHPEIEADDCIGTIVTKWEQEKGKSSLIVSNDKDLFQLLSDKTTQLMNKKGKEYNIRPEHLVQKFNVSAHQWVDCKALLGDASDNIPGCPGVGEKAAYPLIAEYYNLEKLYERLNDLNDTTFKRYVKKLEEGKEMTFLSRQLAQIRCDAEDLIKPSFNEMKVNFNRPNMLQSFEMLGFKSLIHHIEQGVYRVG